LKVLSDPKSVGFLCWDLKRRMIYNEIDYH
jgi:hypothetical protein